MSPPEVWGPAVWTLFHTLCEKINEEAFSFIKVELFNQIRRICGFLPCPECSSDATNFLGRINTSDIKNKSDFRTTFYLFHNWVNAKKRKQLFNYSNLTMYNNYSFVSVINNFILKYNTKGNMKLIAESFQRKLIVNEFKSWIKRNINAFITPNIVRTPISVSEKETIVVQEENQPIVQEQQNVVQEENHPIVQENQPIVQEEQNVVQEENQPIVQEEKPIVQEEQNVLQEENQPIVQEEKPIVVAEETIYY